MDCMDCNEVGKMLQLYVDGELTTQDIESIRQHLEKCSPCEEHFESEKLIKPILKEKLNWQHANDGVLEGVKDFVMHQSV